MYLTHSFRPAKCPVAPISLMGQRLTETKTTRGISKHPCGWPRSPTPARTNNHKANGETTKSRRSLALAPPERRLRRFRLRTESVRSYALLDRSQEGTSA